MTENDLDDSETGDGGPGGLTRSLKNQWVTARCGRKHAQVFSMLFDPSPAPLGGGNLKMLRQGSIDSGAYA